VSGVSVEAAGLVVLLSGLGSLLDGGVLLSSLIIGRLG